MGGEIAHQDPVNVRIERGRRLLRRERRQLLLAARRAEIAPVVEDVQLRCAERTALAQRHASGKRPRLQLQRRQGHLQPHAMQDERLLADARALALAELVGEARAGALLQTEDLQAKQLRAGDVHQCLARILVRMKHADSSRRARAGSSSPIAAISTAPSLRGQPDVTLSQEGFRRRL